jgi:hypothetical protein
MQRSRLFFRTASIRPLYMPREMTQEERDRAPKDLRAATVRLQGYLDAIEVSRMHPVPPIEPVTLYESDGTSRKVVIDAVTCPSCNTGRMYKHEESCVECRSKGSRPRLQGSRFVSTPPTGVHS